MLWVWPPRLVILLLVLVGGALGSRYSQQYSQPRPPRPSLSFYRPARNQTAQIDSNFSENLSNEEKKEEDVKKKVLVLRKTPERGYRRSRARGRRKPTPAGGSGRRLRHYYPVKRQKQRTETSGRESDTESSELSTAARDAVRTARERSKTSEEQSSDASAEIDSEQVAPLDDIPESDISETVVREDGSESVNDDQAGLPRKAGVEPSGGASRDLNTRPTLVARRQRQSPSLSHSPHRHHQHQVLHSNHQLHS